MVEVNDIHWVLAEIDHSFKINIHINILLVDDSLILSVDGVKIYKIYSVMTH